MGALGVGYGGLGGNTQRLGDLAIGRSAGDEDQHLELPRSESGRSGLSFARALSRAGQDGVHCAGIETAGTNLTAKLARGLFGCHPWSVRTRLPHGPIGAGSGATPPSCAG